VESASGHLALALVMEDRLALPDTVRVLMARERLDRETATEAILRAVEFASNEYAGHPLERRLLSAA
jgi:hypothetical protein